MIARAMTIAGSDSGGGAGIQADLKTMTAFGVYGTSVITALTAQNTLGVVGIHDVPPAFVEAQIEAVLSDIGADAIKTGMLVNAAIVRAVALCLRRSAVRNLVVDPVMLAKGGDPLLAGDAADALMTELLPLATVVTPNVHEARVLSGVGVVNAASAREAALRILDLGPKWVLIKGGHRPEAQNAIDFLTDGVQELELLRPRIQTSSTHGTGCTYSAAICACVARGMAMPAAVTMARDYIQQAIATAPGIGAGHGPTNHLVGLSGAWMAP